MRGYPELVGGGGGGVVGGEMRSKVYQWDGVSFWEKKCFKLDCGNGCTTLWIG